MKTKLLSLSIIALLNIGFANGQTKDKYFLLSNTKFEIFIHSTAIFDSTNKNPSAIYLKADLSQNIKEQFYRLSKATVIQLLTDPETDWATNLLLYEKFEKDAYLFSTVIHSRMDWLPVKKSDIAYWKKNLK